MVQKIVTPVVGIGFLGPVLWTWTVRSQSGNTGYPRAQGNVVQRASAVESWSRCYWPERRLPKAGVDVQASKRETVHLVSALEIVRQCYWLDHRFPMAGFLQVSSSSERPQGETVINLEEGSPHFLSQYYT
uniref:Uncharacterized protein n=1 Tax=Anopheles funestus TaxID=62324 RepID=A0A182S1P4_ANOFN